MNAPISPNALRRPALLVDSSTADPASGLAGPLKLGGMVPFSATDFPGSFSLVVFVQGCPWRCGYCHNPHLQVRGHADVMPWSVVLARLRRRIGLIDAVVFSGGEPTIDPALPDAMRQVRSLGFKVGLHTAGTYPQRLAQVLPLVDWVGLDIKALARAYDGITGTAGSAGNAFASARLVLDSGVGLEVRTTMHSLLHSAPHILELAHPHAAQGLRHYALQLFRATGCDDPVLAAAPAAVLPPDLLLLLEGLFESFTLRRD